MLSIGGNRLGVLRIGREQRNAAFEMAKGNIPVGRFYASYSGDCTYELNSSRIKIVFIRKKSYIIRKNH